MNTTRHFARRVGLCALMSLLVAMIYAPRAVLAQAPDQPNAQAQHLREDKPVVTLKPGDPAPPLAVGKWIKGEPVTQFEKDKIYVIECWATWCGPCVAAIPHVTELQKKYAKDGLIVIGQNVWEEDTSKVEPFVKKMGDKMDYRVVLDDTTDGGSGKMAQTWLAAAGQDGIPCSFIVGKTGKIEWIGHPMVMEPVLKQVIAGTFDAQKQAKLDAAKQQLGQDLTRAMRAGNVDQALKVIDAFETQNPEMAGELAGIRFQLLLEKKDYDAAYKAAATAGQAFNDNPQALNEISWMIVDTPGLEKRDLDLAEKLASRAVELTERDDAAILDTLARVYFEKGRIDKAVELQTEAVSKAPQEQKGQLEATLEKYRKAKAQ
ncbi:redoxin family protein [Fontivita pretiosa]|uniref:TlpA disulfide reductase family protein n=1 Tax=Fontivita pretiosa TaxID=2989684 RepID=UPI003D181A7C